MTSRRSPPGSARIGSANAEAAQSVLPRIAAKAFSQYAYYSCNNHFSGTMRPEQKDLLRRSVLPCWLP